jgi:hypothetical protein
MFPPIIYQTLLRSYFARNRKQDEYACPASDQPTQPAPIFLKYPIDTVEVFRLIKANRTQ